MSESKLKKIANNVSVEEIMANNNALKLHEAMRYAEEKHRGQKRKGSELAYITHSLEVAQILAPQKPTLELLIAGVLHDVLEDTDATAQEVEEKFGKMVLELIKKVSEKKEEDGKKLSWKKRKDEALNKLVNADTDVKQLVMADTVSNLRSMVYDYSLFGEKLWERFNADRENISWYYDSKIEMLTEFKDYEETRYEYWEMNGLFKYLFVNFYYAEDAEQKALYQECRGNILCFRKGTPGWTPVDNLPDNAVSITKDEAEKREDFWLGIENVQKTKGSVSYMVHSPAQGTEVLDLIKMTWDNRVFHLKDNGKWEEYDREFAETEDSRDYRIMDEESAKLFVSEVRCGETRKEYVRYYYGSVDSLERQALTKVIYYADKAVMQLYKNYRWYVFKEYDGPGQLN